MKEFRLAGGRSLAFLDEGSGPPLILLHGWSMSSAVFSEVMPVLASRFRVLVPDLPGHGDSDPPAPAYRFAAIAADLAEWLRALGVEKGALLGWSMGGQIAMELGHHGRPLLEKLILVSTTPRFVNEEDWTCGLPPGQVKAMKRNLRRDFRGTTDQFFRSQFEGEGLAGGRIDQIAWLLFRASRSPDPQALEMALTSLVSEDQRSVVRDLHMPSLVVHGTLDRIVPLSAGQYLAERLETSRLARIDTVGHAPFLSRPQEMIDLWLDFLS